MKPLESALVVLAFLTLAARPAPAQTTEDTVVYAIQSDWDPPKSVLRESIIPGYNVFDHLAARDLKTNRVVPAPQPSTPAPARP